MSCLRAFTVAAVLTIVATTTGAAPATTTIVTYPDPGTNFVDDKFSVNVLAADAAVGTPWAHAPTYTTYAPPTSDGGVSRQVGKTASLTQVSFDGPLRVECTRTGGALWGSVVVRPLSLNLIPTVTDGGATLELLLPAPDQPGAYQLSIENNGDLANPLLIFANPLEEDEPDPLDEAVTVYQPGDHFGETMSGVVYVAEVQVQAATATAAEAAVVCC